MKKQSVKKVAERKNDSGYVGRWNIVLFNRDQAKELQVCRTSECTMVKEREVEGGRESKGGREQVHCSQRTKGKSWTKSEFSWVSAILRKTGEGGIPSE